MSITVTPKLHNVCIIIGSSLVVTTGDKNIIWFSVFGGTTIYIVLTGTYYTYACIISVYSC